MRHPITEILTTARLGSRALLDAVELALDTGEALDAMAARCEAEQALRDEPVDLGLVDVPRMRWDSRHDVCGKDEAFRNRAMAGYPGPRFHGVVERQEAA
jgi:hypothetical protein